MSASILRRGSGTLAIPICGVKLSVSALPLVKALKIVVFPLPAGPVIPISILIGRDYQSRFSFFSDLRKRIGYIRKGFLPGVIDDLTLLFLWLAEGQGLFPHGLAVHCPPGPTS